MLVVLLTNQKDYVPANNSQFSLLYNARTTFEYVTSHTLPTAHFLPHCQSTPILPPMPTTPTNLLASHSSLNWVYYNANGILKALKNHKNFQSNNPSPKPIENIYPPLAEAIENAVLRSLGEGGSLCDFAAKNPSTAHQLPSCQLTTTSPTIHRPPYFL